VIHVIRRDGASRSIRRSTGFAPWRQRPLHFAGKITA